MRQFTNKKANDIEVAIINAIANEVNGVNDTFNIDIEVSDTIIIADGSVVFEGNKVKFIMIDNFNAYDEDGEEKEIEVDTLKVEDEVIAMVA